MLMAVLVKIQPRIGVICITWVDLGRCGRVSSTIIDISI
ncbi:hypothetical protein MARPO_0076s0078 [Marchantia polymorpha]|uniref:Uncharacterized protein n=1 Tax=Marchantia polymorpha TaxID=3197 RepID=A0A2R6WLV6_MARPO|nr:hypothetical protein MARPO_0076s0078 [Marchantia polymorpha]|eukprot:PTQ34844.1 hypothetical protein MARPO_0076s0078 [Marchantia polymorpha]